MVDYIYQYVVGGSYFVYKGVKYGKGTVFKFKDEFYERIGKPVKTISITGRMEKFDSIVIKNGKPIWYIWNNGYLEDVVPERDILGIPYPVYYFEPKELAHRRFDNGTWVNYIFNDMFPGYVIFMLIAIVAHPAQRWSAWIILTVFFVIYTYLKICGKEK